MTNVSVVLLQVAVGVFFAISGYHKLFNAKRHAGLVKTLEEDHVPLVRFNQWFVPTVELVAGAVLPIASGLVAVGAALLLLAICGVACAVDGLKRIAEWKPIDVADWIDDLLYLPETLLALMLVVVVIERL